MLLIWRGWGLLVIPIVIAVAGAVSVGLGMLAAASGLALPSDKAGVFAFAVGLLAAAAANWFIGRRFNRSAGRELVDPQTGQRVILTSRHTLFFIQMEYWSVPVALAAVFLLAGMFR